MFRAMFIVYYIVCLLFVEGLRESLGHSRNEYEDSSLTARLSGE